MKRFLFSIFVMFNFSFLLANEYNISVSSYVESKDIREVIDIHELNKSLVEIVARQNELRTQIDSIVKDLEGAE